MQPLPFVISGGIDRLVGSGAVAWSAAKSMILEQHFDSNAALEREIEQNFRNGRAFVHGPPTAAVFDEVTLRVVLDTSGAHVDFPARVVMVSEAGALVGTGLELAVDHAAATAALHAVLAGPPPTPTEPPTAAEPPPGDLDDDRPDTDPHATAFELDGSADVIDDASLDPPDDLPLDAPEDELSAEDEGAYANDDDAELADTDQDESESADGAERPRDMYTPDRRVPANVNERVRKLTLAEQLKLARTGELNERVAIERLCGKAVWEPLLSNPRITPPEVARIARMGTCPRPILDQIVGNASWLHSNLVRRALLTNPRVSEEGCIRVLRAMPKPELKIAEKQRSYTLVARNAAKKLLRGGP
ncbi:MAG: hypothetical protein R3A78_03170 [Polyangiales bacterium]|nr:hypothetical protein [Myxococcales bacterium]